MEVKQPRPLGPWDVFFAIFQITLACIAYRWWHALPPTGYAVAVIAVAAAAMSIQGDMRGWQKAIWMLVIGAFLILELKAIKKDKIDYDAQQASTRAREELSFKGIGDDITESIRRSDHNFNATMEKSNVISLGLQDELLSTNKLLGLSNKTLETITGGDSFCFVHMGGTDAGFQVVLYQRGRNNVFDLNIRIIDLDAAAYEFDTSFPIIQRDGGFGDSSYKKIGNILVPSNVTDKRYNVFILARNGVFTELIRLHRLSSNTWSEAILVSATYQSNKPVRVLDQVGPQFPVELFDNEANVKWLRKEPLIKVKQ